MFIGRNYYVDIKFLLAGKSKPQRIDNNFYLMIYIISVVEVHPKFENKQFF